eukprot:2971225-Prymnesium_polylepis.3
MSARPANMPLDTFTQSLLLFSKPGPAMASTLDFLANTRACPPMIGSRKQRLTISISLPLPWWCHVAELRTLTWSIPFATWREISLARSESMRSVIHTKVESSEIANSLL